MEAALELSPASCFELPSRSNTGAVCLPQIPGDSRASKDHSSRRWLVQSRGLGQGFAPLPAVAVVYLQRAGGGAARHPQPLVLPPRTVPANNWLQQSKPNRGCAAIDRLRS